MKKIVWVLTACVLLASGGDLEDGLSAYDKKDYKKAVALYQKAADQGDVSAQTKLGVMYANGLGVRQNTSKAKELYGKACDEGDNLGCRYYAILNKR